MVLNRHELMQELSHELGIKISAHEGAALILFKDDERVWLEYPDDSAMITIHCVVKEGIDAHFSAAQLEKILYLNSRVEMLCGGWLGLHKPTQSLRFFVAIPVQFALVTVVADAIKNAIPVRREIIELLN